MKRSKFTEAQIAFILRQGAEGTAVGEVFRILVFEGGVIRSLLPGVDPPFHPLRACPQPSGRTTFVHLHDCAPGIPETHMVGSERFVCVLCKHVTFADSDGASRFPFTFDKVAAGR